MYTKEKNTLILIALLKAHGIKKIIASPGAMNINFVASVQHDSFFEVYSAPDERSAAYMACGMAAESKEPVVLSCTGATASRNYAPGLTEAFYRKLPILAITSTKHIGKIGSYVPQVIDRTVQMKDLVKLSVLCSTVNDAEDEWACTINVNKAIAALKKDGGGPVHINLVTTHNRDFTTPTLPEVRKIDYYSYSDKFPDIPKGNIGIFVGSHTKWNDSLIKKVEKFCEKYNAVVFCDHTSGYRGKYHVMVNLLTFQSLYKASCNKIDLLIHIGEVTGSYHQLKIKNVWRVSPDGELRDTYNKLSKIFDVDEEYFFNYYGNSAQEYNYSSNLLEEWQKENQELKNIVMEKEVPFSNIWIAKNTANKLPKNSVLHLGILNSLRTWNFFDVDESIIGYSNTGGFGIDGNLSSLIGASLVNKDKLYFCVIGDLAFFYDMNSLGNRHVSNNIRIILINNGKGTEFKNYSHEGAQFGDDTDEYIAAARHYGNKSKNLVKHYAEDLGFEYFSASNKEEYLNIVDKITLPTLTEKPMLVEIFTTDTDESNALKIMCTLKKDTNTLIKDKVKNIIGPKNIQKLKKIIKK